MRILTIGNMFTIPAFLYDIFLYGGILLTFISIGMLLFGTMKKKSGKIWLIVFIAGVLMLVPVVLSMIYGLGERIA